MRYRKLALALIVAGAAISLGGCAKEMALLQAASSAVEFATTTAVPASVVIPAANTFDVLKGTATNYGHYCINNQMPEPICSAGNRRLVVKFVRSGTEARRQLEDSVINGTPAAASIYNVLVAAVQGLQKSPVASSQFGATP